MSAKYSTMSLNSVVAMVTRLVSFLFRLSSICGDREPGSPFIPHLLVILSNTCQSTGSTKWRNQQFGCAPCEDSDQPGHLTSLIRVFAVCMKKPWVLSYPLRAQQRLWSDWVDAQADLSLRWVHNHFVGFVMSGLKFLLVHVTCLRDPSFMLP